MRSLLNDLLWAAGVLFNPLCPEWLQTALLTVLLLVVVRKTFQKGFRQWSEERKGTEKACAPMTCWPASFHLQSRTAQCMYNVMTAGFLPHGVRIEAATWCSLQRHGVKP